MLRVHLVDNDYLARPGMERLFEGLPDIELESVPSTGDAAIGAALELTPDVVLVEPAVRDVDGLVAVREITGRAPGTKVAMLSSVVDHGTICDAYRAGAVSYLSESTISSDLDAAIRMIHRGESIFSMPPEPDRFPMPVEQAESFGTQLIQRLCTCDGFVLRGLVSGRTNAQIAAALHVSEAMVKAQITRITARVDVSGRVQLAVLAVRAGVGEP